MATHKEQRWQNERQRWRTKGAAGAVGSKQPVGQSVVLAPRVERWSCDKMLAAIQQVFPLEEPEPSGFPAGVMLKPYQRQSLAFMLDVERSTDPTLLGGTGFRGGWLVGQPHSNLAGDSWEILVGDPRGRSSWETLVRRPLKSCVSPDSI